MNSNTNIIYSTAICCQPMSPPSKSLSSGSQAPGTTPSLLGLMRIRLLKSNHLIDKVCSSGSSGSENVDVSSAAPPRRTRARRASLPLLTCTNDSTGSSSSSLRIKFLSSVRKLSLRNKTKTLERSCAYSPSSSDNDENQKEEASPFSECNVIISSAIPSGTLTAAVSSSAVVPDLPSLSYGGTSKLHSNPSRSSALLHDSMCSDCRLAVCAVEDRPCELPTTPQQPSRRAPPVRSSSLLNVTIGSSCTSSALSSISSLPVESSKVMLTPSPLARLPRSRSIPEEEMRNYHSNNNKKGGGVVQFDLEPTVHFIDIAHDDDRDMLWWNHGDLRERQVLERYMNSEPVATPNARDYYETSAHIYHEVSCGGQIHHDLLTQLLPGLDNGLRGTEINCTEVGTRRKERSREIVRLIVTAQGKRADRHRPESLRFQSCRFTKNSRKIAAILAVADRMAVEADFEYDDNK